MALPGNVDVIRVRGYWFSQDGTGSGKSITFTPSKSLLIDSSAHAYIQLAPVTVLPAEGDSYFFADLIASNDPDLQSVTWSVALEGEPPTFVITVPYDAPVEDVGDGSMKAVWLTEAAA